MFRACLVIGVSLLIGTGCAHKLELANPNLRKKPWLTLTDGYTTKQDILAKWGPPPREMLEEGRIFFYRLERNYEVFRQEESYPFNREKKFQWDGVRYSLVLVFDAEDVLKKHSIIRVR